MLSVFSLLNLIDVLSVFRHCILTQFSTIMQVKQLENVAKCSWALGNGWGLGSRVIACDNKHILEMDIALFVT